MLSSILRLSKGRYHALNRIEVSASALLHNYSYLTRKNKAPVFPVLKSDAYGHGIVLVAKIMDKLKAPFLCVDSIYEAYQLLKAEIKTPILIMGYVHPESLGVKKLPFSYAIYSREMLEAIHTYQPHAGVHLFVDTGMNREGIPLQELKKFILACKASHMKIEGLMSHLAMSDKPNDKSTKNQADNFKVAQKIMEEEGGTPHWIHLGASSFILNREGYPSLIGNAARAGIALYGIDPENKDTNIKPALTLLSTVVQIKNLDKGEKVGYDFTYTAKTDRKIAILPLGYNDGINRGLSNKGSVLVKGVACPILGRVSMNISVIDVTEAKNVAVGDETVVYSNNPGDINSITNSAKLCGTISYELLVYLAASTKRIMAE